MFVGPSFFPLILLSLGPNFPHGFFMCVLINIDVSLFFLSLCLLSLAVMPRFTEQVESAVEALSANPSQPVDENEFIDASRLVYDGIRDIRKAVLMIRVSCVVFFNPSMVCVRCLAAFSFQS